MKRRRNFGTLRTPLGDVPVMQEATARALHDMQVEIKHLHDALTAARKRIAELEASCTTETQFPLAETSETHPQPHPTPSATKPNASSDSLVT